MATFDPDAPPIKIRELDIWELPQWLSVLTDGNNRTPPDFLVWTSVKDILTRVLAAMEKAEAQAKFKAIQDNEDFDPVQKAHKSELLASKTYLEALKPLGFKTGVDCKKAISQISFAQNVKQENPWLSDEERAELEALCKRLIDASEVYCPRDNAVNANAPANAPAA